MQQLRFQDQNYLVTSSRLKLYGLASFQIQSTMGASLLPSHPSQNAFRVKVVTARRLPYRILGLKIVEADDAGLLLHFLFSELHRINEGPLQLSPFRQIFIYIFTYCKNPFSCRVCSFPMIILQFSFSVFARFHKSKFPFYFPTFHLSLFCFEKNRQKSQSVLRRSKNRNWVWRTVR